MSSKLDTAREVLAKGYTATEPFAGVSTVTFQPLMNKRSQDRVVAQQWDVAGQKWLFLAVCDGHAGEAAVDHTVEKLPDCIRTALAAIPSEKLSRDALLADQSTVGSVLSNEIEQFDAALGEALKAVCADPTALSDEEGKQIAVDNAEVIQRAQHGTTVAAALIIPASKLLWSIGLGDSTLALAFNGEGNVPQYEVLNESHGATNSTEAARVAEEHPNEPNAIVFASGTQRVLGSIMLTRAIGDFALKLDKSYLEKIMQHVPNSANPKGLQRILEYSQTPPYLSATPHVRLVDLSGYTAPKLFIFSDGVEAITMAAFRDPPDEGVNTAEILATLLRPDWDKAKVEETLGNGVQTGWHLNVAVDLLGNVVGGTDIARLHRITNQEGLSEMNPYIDDTSIIVCDVEAACA